MPLIMLVLFLALAGCGRHVQLAKDGGTQQDLDRDRYDCESRGGKLSLGPMPNWNEIQHCLENKGWRVVAPNPQPQQQAQR